MKYDDEASKSTVDAFTGRTNKRGGKRDGAGRKGKWYGKTVALRVPEVWAQKIQYCMDNEITPSFEPVQNQIEAAKTSQDSLKALAVHKWKTDRCTATDALRWAKEQGLKVADSTIAKNAKARLEQWEKSM